MACCYIRRDIKISFIHSFIHSFTRLASTHSTGSIGMIKHFDLSAPFHQFLLRHLASRLHDRVNHVARSADMQRQIPVANTTPMTEMKCTVRVLSYIVLSLDAWWEGQLTAD